MKAKMKKLVLVTVVVAAAAGGLSALNRLAADDQSPISASGQRVRIIGGPELEKASDNWAIIRWTTNNVRRTSLRCGVVHSGTDRLQLSQTAKSPNRCKGALSSMIYRVQMNHLKPGTIYYFRVESVDATGKVDGSESAVNQFTTERSP